MGASTIITIKDISVARAKSDDGPQGARRAFNALESKMETLRGRKMYGAFYKIAGDYFACVGLDAEYPDDMGFEKGVIPGGLYARRKIADWEKHVSDIWPAFENMSQEMGELGYEVDIERPSVEFYRSQRELFLMLPIK